MKPMLSPCTSNAIRYFWKKTSSSDPFKKGGRYSIIGSSLRISLAIWMHLIWNLRFFLDSDFFVYSSIIGLIFAFLASSLCIASLQPQYIQEGLDLANQF